MSNVPSPIGGPKRIVILGAAGRDFHDFNMVYRTDPNCEVVAFTATQIPNISNRCYPPELAGPRYPVGIPIYPERDLDRLIREYAVDEVVFAYSDVSHADVMHHASIALAAGADFRLLGPRHTQLRSTKPVVALCAVRTGSGKSPATRYVGRVLRDLGHRVVAVRHPMPYGDLARQAVQRFGELADLDRYNCTLEEREEYEPLVEAGIPVFAGVDYEQILRRAEQEADVLIWDGGNNDLPFFIPDLHVVLADACRPGHETLYHPGEANARAAHVLVVSKVNSAEPAAVQAVRANLQQLNPKATLVEAALQITVANPDAIRGKRVLVVEDGPTVTHGGMPHGAGWLATPLLSSRDCRSAAVGSRVHSGDLPRASASGPRLASDGLWSSDDCGAGSNHPSSAGRSGGGWNTNRPHPCSPGGPTDCPCPLRVSGRRQPHAGGLDPVSLRSAPVRPFKQRIR